MKRKIAAILAADVVGYSRMISEDEEDTLRRLISYREVFSDFVGRGSGRIFNTAGDAVFAEFPSAVDALRAAIEIQESIRTRNLAFPESRHMRFRIGMTIGDVVERDGDLLGDGVNVAARLEGLAEPGGICISRSVHEQVGGKLSVTFTDIGPQSVKNIPNPVHAFTIPAAGRREEPREVGAPPARRTRSAVAGLAAVCALAALLGGLFLATREGGTRKPAIAPPALPAARDTARATSPAGAPNAVPAGSPAAPGADAPSRPFALPAAADPSTLIYGTDGKPRPDAARPTNVAFSAAAVPFMTDANRLKIAAKLLGRRNEALAISTNGAAGWSWSGSTEDDAKAGALKGCYDRMGGRCRVFALNGTVIWPDPLPDMPPLPWVDATAPRTPFEARRLGRIGDQDRARLEADYPTAKQHKALAIGSDHWTFVDGKDSASEAERVSLERCGAAAAIACRIVAVDADFVVAPGEPQLRSDQSPRSERATACDAAAVAPFDPLRPKDVPGVRLALIDPDTAVPACEAAAVASPNDARTRYQLGRAYIAAKAPDRARESFERAAGGDPEALAAIGYLYEAGLGTPANFPQSVAWYRKAVDAGSVDGLLNLGIAWSTGRGVPKDTRMASVFWERAVEKGSADGMYLLGKLLASGADGVARDAAKAAVLFQRAAEAGHADAAETLGRMFEEGDGVSKDAAQAMSWYRRALASGSTRAAFDIRRLTSSAN